MQRLPAGMEKLPAREVKEERPPHPERDLTALHGTMQGGGSPPSDPPGRSDIEDAELPEWGGETRVVLLVVNPYLIHVFWDIDPRTLASINPQQLTGEEGTPALLRFYDMSEGTSPSNFDVAIDLQSKSSYVQLWQPARSYYAELGLSSEGGGFLPLARSNTVQTPRAWPVVNVGEQPIRVSAESPQQREPSPPPPPEPPSPAPKAISTPETLAAEKAESTNIVAPPPLAEPAPAALEQTLLAPEATSAPEPLAAEKAGSTNIVAPAPLAEPAPAAAEQTAAFPAASDESAQIPRAEVTETGAPLHEPSPSTRVEDSGTAPARLETKQPEPQDLTGGAERQFETGISSPLPASKERKES